MAGLLLNSAHKIHLLGFRKKHTMSEASTTSVTQLLQAWRAGDQTAFDQLLPLVQEELHRLAKRLMSRERQGHTWQTTELVNEAYLRLIGQQQVEWQDRAHFFAVASQVMRHLLVDHARSRQQARHGGGGVKMSRGEVAVGAPGRVAELLGLGDALDRLARFDKQKSRIVELRYFGGLTVEEVAEVLGIAAITVKREWARAKLWLYKELLTS